MHLLEEQNSTAIEANVAVCDPSFNAKFFSLSFFFFKSNVEDRHSNEGQLHNGRWLFTNTYMKQQKLTHLDRSGLSK